MRLNMRSNVRHTQIIDLNSAPIDYGVKSMVGWEMFVYEAKECSPYIGFYLEVKGGIVPNDFPFSTTGTTSRSWCVVKLVIKPGLLQDFLVFNGRSVKLFFVA